MQEKNEYMLNESLIGADAGMDIALRFSALMAQAEEGNGIYEDPARADAVLSACRNFFEDAKAITQGAALRESGLDHDMMEEAVQAGQTWRGAADNSGYDELARRLGASDLTAGQQSFEALQDFAQALRDANALEGVMLPIEGVAKDDSQIPGSVEKASTQEFYGMAMTGTQDGVMLFGNQITPENAFEAMTSFVDTFRPDVRDSIMAELDNESAGIRARSMLFQVETHQTKGVMERMSEELQQEAY